MEPTPAPLTHTTGPLTDRQHDVIRSVIKGEQHVTIAARYGFVRVTIAQEARRIVAKLGAPNMTAAVAQYTRAQTLKEVADRLDAATTGALIDELTADIRAEADRLVP
jgi:DNA-binding NarL/FixJ family response regulator